MEGVAGKGKGGRTWMTSAKFWTPCPLVTVSNKPILLSFGPLSLSPSPPSKCRRHWSFAPKEGRRNVATPDKKCAPLSLSRNGFVFLSFRFASRPHSSVDRAIRSRLQHQRSSQIKTPLGCSTVCKIFCGSGYSLVHFVYTKCGEKRENVTC